MSVAVIKLGVGNTASVLFALERLGARAVLTDDPDVVKESERVILPGVGAASYASRVLRERGLDVALRAFTRPLLGVCLGQQLLYEWSEEGGAEGLGRMAGKVTALPNSRDWPSPHMGWSRLQNLREHPLLEGVATDAYVYFVHAYACPVDARSIATASYGRTFAAASAEGNAFGCQFHPERSGAVGARVLVNFLAAPC
ncbi:imidazole glycerol phosphate synthase subunit HisH [Terricaulis sp.]|uniref:imidazole glycerol phosphate synthase subunit HisH n=1 Tax=Terricaulis sp. TaxID=2768686 RepID=UPI003784F172